jgi:hypothetical protein
MIGCFSRHFLVPSNNLKPKSINECMPMIGARFYAHIDNLHVRGDILENELAKVSHRNNSKQKLADLEFEKIGHKRAAVSHIS